MKLIVHQDLARSIIRGYHSARAARHEARRSVDCEIRTEPGDPWRFVTDLRSAPGGYYCYDLREGLHSVVFPPNERADATQARSHSRSPLWAAFSYEAAKEWIESRVPPEPTEPPSPAPVGAVYAYQLTTPEPTKVRGGEWWEPGIWEKGKWYVCRIAATGQRRNWRWYGSGHMHCTLHTWGEEVLRACDTEREAVQWVTHYRIRAAKEQQPTNGTPEHPANKDERGNGRDGKHYWLTPPELFEELREEFGEMYDPCPYPRPPGFDGLSSEWGPVNYVNPLFITVRDADGRRVGMTAWIRKAIEEQAKGRTSVLVFPQHRWVHMLVEAGAEMRSIGDVRWIATEDGSQMDVGCTSPIMLFILRGNVKGRKRKRKG